MLTPKDCERAAQRYVQIRPLYEPAGTAPRRWEEHVQVAEVMAAWLMAFGLVPGADVVCIETATGEQLDELYGLERPRCPGCNSETDPETCWCGDAMSDHLGLSHNHGPVPMGCNCHRLPREIRFTDIIAVGTEAWRWPCDGGWPL